MEKLVIAVDIGGTNIRAALCTQQGEIMERIKIPTEAHEGPEKVTGRIIDCINHVLGATSKQKILGLGVAIAGAVNPRTAVICKAVNLPGFENWPLRDVLIEEYDLPVHLIIDSLAAALAEYKFCRGYGSNTFIYLTISTGLGGGVIDNGHLILGAHGIASELGHIIVEPEGPQCKCGNFGCLSLYSSGAAIAQYAKTLISEGRHSIILDMVEGDLDLITAEEVIQAAINEDELALKVTHRAATYLGIGMVSMVHAFDPEKFIIGGGVSRAGDLLFPRAREIIDERVMSDEQRNMPIVISTLGDDASILGAVAFLLDNVMGNGL